MSTSPNVFESPNGEEIYFLGIIDTLTLYRFRKKLEATWKACTQKDPSCVHPDNYHKRFYDFMAKSIVPMNRPNAPQANGGNGIRLIEENVFLAP